MGDPAGIGPEVIVAAWRNPSVHAVSRPLVVGHPAILRRAVALLESSIEIVEISDPAEADATPEILPCIAVETPGALDVPPGVIDPRAGCAAFESLSLAVELALAGRVDALVTAPLNKAAFNQAGYHYPGHTEYLAERCGITDFAMMLYLGPMTGIGGPAGLGVAHVTLHAALRDVFAELTSESVVAKTRLLDRMMNGLMERPARIGVCALNPHAGEQGLFGDEEEQIIRPAVERAAAEGINVNGPIAADALLVRARDGEFDGVVAMYHDQGHIALKLLARHRAVNVTLGLPIIRTSVAHGTAFDIAWQKRADESSMIEAIRVASQLARLRKRCQEPFCVNNGTTTD